ncbi:unnamed protein product, partial [Heterosigma akashiwo]
IVALALADVTEPKTGIKFADRFGGLGLAGVGVRVKQIGPLSVKVYGVGMYMDESSALEEISEYAGGKKADSGFFSRLRKPSIDKKIVLKMARSVGSETMSEALAESIKPRMSGDLPALSSFQTVLLKGLSEDGSAKKGTELAFDASGGKLNVKINGKSAGDVESSSLCDAFVDTYMDDKGVSPTLRDSIAETLCAKLPTE